MVCKDCKEKRHSECPEVTRQASDLSEVEKAASSLCDCQHQDS